MALVLHGHPFSSYTQKVLIALYENATPFTWRVLDGPDAFAELARLWPIRLMPVLVDDGTPLAESSVIIEHLALAHPGPVPLIPDAAQTALKVRLLDRFFDLYVMTPMQKITGDKLRQLRQDGEPDAKGVADARARLDVAYGWLEKELSGRQWACGDNFSMADCAAAPSLFYADWTHPIGAQFTNVHAYRARLLKRPSFARAVDEARPFRKFFPLGAPDRD
jgi:glutathione S-transferase